MKKVGLLILFAITGISAFAQLPEDFNTQCLASAHPNSPWVIYNPIAATSPDGAWQCTPTDGKPNGSTTTPGAFCTGFYLGAHHLDTSYLITQQLNFTSTTHPGGHVYLRFDSKKVDISTSGKLTAMMSTEPSFTIPDSFRTVNDSDVSPMFAERDASEWVTHEIDLSDSIDKGPFFFAFRFTSSNIASLAWYIDNIQLVTSSLSVDAVTRQVLPISIVGSSSTSKIELSYTARTAGNYHISVYDLVGRQVYNGMIEAKTGTSNYTINGLDLHPGIYCIKMGNENAYGTAKLIIQ